MIHPTYSDATGRHGSHVEASASADLDSLSASMFAYSDDASIFATYAVSFSDSLTVLGGSGPGTLIAHFHVISENAQFRTPGYAPSPSYNFQLGQAGLGFTANLPTDPPNPDNGGREVDDIDVSSPFVFGQPLPLAAGAFAHESPRSDRGTFVGVRSSVIVSGYRC